MDYLKSVHNTDPSSLHLTYHGVRKHLDLVSKHSLEVVKFHKNLSMILEDFKKEMDTVSISLYSYFAITYTLCTLILMTYDIYVIIPSCSVITCCFDFGLWLCGTFWFSTIKLPTLKSKSSKNMSLPNYHSGIILKKTYHIADTSI